MRLYKLTRVKEALVRYGLTWLLYMNPSLYEKYLRSAVVELTFNQMQIKILELTLARWEQNK